MFLRGYDVAADGNFSDASHPATVSSFVLDAYEVTVGRFRAFVLSGHGTQLTPPAVGAGAHPLLPGSGWDPGWDAMLAPDTELLVTGLVDAPCAGYATWTNSVGSNETLPINCVGWAMAMAFCIWDGGYLPTEAEWNFAASGGSEHRAYPWSSPPDTLSINYDVASYDCMGDGLLGCAMTDLLPVGSKPAGAGRWRHMDLAGNLGEWVLDVYADPLLDPCVDCALLVGSQRGIRGGSFFRPDGQARAAARGASEPFQSSIDVGFRCARPPP